MKTRLEIRGGAADYGLALGRFDYGLPPGKDVCGHSLWVLGAGVAGCAQYRCVLETGPAELV